MMNSFGSTISSGIQDISALLPLLGTEQCENHIGAGLNHGFLYPAATPLSIFGSLGIAKGGLKAFFASVISHRFKFIGAKALKAGGFAVDKKNEMSSILFDEEEDCYGAEKQLRAMLNDLHLNDPGRITVEATQDTSVWNIQMVAYSLLFSILGLTPYMHLNLHSRDSTLVKWLFPSLRVLGSFIVTACTQLVMQHRVLTIVRRKLIYMAIQHDVKVDWMTEDSIRSTLESHGSTDACLWDLLDSRLRVQIGNEKTTKLAGCDLEQGKPHQGTTFYRWPNDPVGLSSDLERKLRDAEEYNWYTLLTLQVLLLIGSVFIIAGYVGCFSIVQGSSSILAPLVWLILESMLSLLRLLLWVSNPKWDDNTGILFKIGLVNHPPLPTLITAHDSTIGIITYPFLAIPEAQFFEMITVYTGPTTRLKPRPSNENISFFYTLTFKTNDTYKVLITIFDSGASKAMVFSEGQLFEAKFIQDRFPQVSFGNLMNFADHYVTRDANFMEVLGMHYRSIIECIYRKDFRTNSLSRLWSMNASKDEQTVVQAELLSSGFDQKFEEYYKDYLSLRQKRTLLSFNLNERLSRIESEIERFLESYRSLTESKYPDELERIKHIWIELLPLIIAFEGCCLAEAKRIENALYHNFTITARKLTKISNDPDLKEQLEGGWSYWSWVHLSNRRDRAVRRFAMLSEQAPNDDRVPEYKSWATQVQLVRDNWDTVIGDMGVEGMLPVSQHSEEEFSVAFEGLCTWFTSLVHICHLKGRWEKTAGGWMTVWPSNRPDYYHC